MSLFYSWKFLNAGGEIVLNPEREEAERLARLREAWEERRFSREWRTGSGGSYAATARSCRATVWTPVSSEGSLGWCNMKQKVSC